MAVSEVTAWYFSQVEGDYSAYGGRLRGYVYGKILCIISARGDLTLEVYRKLGPAPGECASTPHMHGQFWVAGGIGFCEDDDGLLKSGFSSLYRCEFGSLRAT